MINVYLFINGEYIDIVNESHLRYQTRENKYFSGSFFFCDFLENEIRYIQNSITGNIL